MKLSCLPVSLYPELTAGTRTLADWFHFAAELGLDGADVSVVHLPGRTPADLAPVRQQADDAGVQIAMLVTYADFTHPDAADDPMQGVWQFKQGFGAQLQPHIGAWDFVVSAPLYALYQQVMPAVLGWMRQR